MAAPVSIGDAILLSQLAYRLGHAVISGRKQAPSGIREVQNQLYALGKALESVDQCTEKQIQSQIQQSLRTGHQASTEGGGDRYAALGMMVKNCRDTLEQMENFMSRYRDIEQPADSKSSSSNWRKEVKANWKKIRWTTETGELDTIRGNLKVHIASLNLFLSGINHSQSKQADGRLGDVHSMVSDLHEWFTKNLKDPRDTKKRGVGGPGSTATNSPTTVHHALDLVFELSREMRPGSTPLVLCPRASFRSGWVDSLVEPSKHAGSIFRCRCPGESHFDGVQYRLVPISLVVRLARQTPVWQIFCVSDEITSLVITGVAPADLAALQEQINLLAASQANLSATNSSSVYCSAGETGPISSVLDCKSETSQFQGQITSVTFISGADRFMQHSIDTVHIFHYRTEGNVGEDMRRNLLHQTWAELVVQPLATGPTTRFIIRVTRLTNIVNGNDLRAVGVLDVFCESQNEDGSNDQRKCDKVEIVCATARSAQKLRYNLEWITQQLQLQYLQFPRLSERVVAQRSCRDVMIDHLYLSSPQAIIVFDPEKQLHRLILRSSSLAAAVTMELPEAVLKRIHDSTSTGAEVMPQAYFVEHSRDGAEVETRLSRFPRELLEAPSEELGRLSL